MPASALLDTEEGGGYSYSDTEGLLGGEGPSLLAAATFPPVRGNVRGNGPTLPLPKYRARPPAPPRRDGVNAACEKGLDGGPEF